MRLLVTGAGGGIGSSVVAAALEQGHQVLAQELSASSLDRYDGQPAVSTIVGDLADRSVLRMLGARAAESDIDAAVLAHGIQGAGALAELSPERVRAILTVNAATVPWVFDAIAPTLRRNAGRFVTVTSQAALRGEPDNAAYCAAKWAAQAWLDAQASLEGPTGVAVRALCPGRTLTTLLKDAMNGFAAAQGQTVEDYTQEILAGVPLRRFAEPAEIAAAALYLADVGPRPSVLTVSGGEVPH